MIDGKAKTQATVYHEEVRDKGRPTTVDALKFDEQVFLIRGKFLKTIGLKHPWQEDLNDPQAVVGELQGRPSSPDILRFWQRIPDSKPQYGFYSERRYPAAIPISTHQHWIRKQVKKSVRNKINNSSRHGLEVREESLTDQLVEGIQSIYDDSPVRRGKPFWHYGKDFDTVKNELSEDPVPATFVTAYVDGELIGFIKLFFYDRYAKTTLILDKQSKRNIGCMNAMISKVVEICAEKGIPYFVYSYWRRGNHGQFQRSNGFEKHEVPEYFVPLTLKGRVAIALRLHRGLKGWVPERLMVTLLNLRARWYAYRFRTKAFRVES